MYMEKLLWNLLFLFLRVWLESSSHFEGSHNLIFLRNHLREFQVKKKNVRWKIKNTYLYRERVPITLGKGISSSKDFFGISDMWVRRVHITIRPQPKKLVGFSTNDSVASCPRGQFSFRFILDKNPDLSTMASFFEDEKHPCVIQVQRLPLEGPTGDSKGL